VGAARHFVVLEVPVINDYDKEDRLGAAKMGYRERKGQCEVLLRLPEKRRRQSYRS